MMCRSADRRRRDRNRREPIRDSRALDHARSIHQNSGALHPRQDLTRRFGGLLITNEEVEPAVLSGTVQSQRKAEKSRAGEDY